MSFNNPEFSQPGSVPEVRVGRFSNSPVLTEAWQNDLGFAYHLVSDRYWYFQGRQLPITRAVSKLILGVTASNLGLSEIGTSHLESHIEHGDNIGRPVSCIGFFTRPYVAIGDPEVAVTKIIQATNEHLAALGSIQLPLDIERPQIDMRPPKL
jgi:hypothetical protein